MARYIGNYEVIRELGAGHFGTVYLAVGEVPGRRGQPGRRRLVAIKKLKDPGNATNTEELLQEFALLDQVKHRGIVRVFEYLADEGAVVMEYIHGVSLRRMFEELQRAREQVFTEAAVEIGCEMADALYQAYTTPGDNGEPLQLVHRDLKPANVLLTPGGEVKILDWGLARVDNADFRPDDTERIKGTLMYMSPEQARGLEVDHSSDLFALGLILYELLENKPVYAISDHAADPFQEVMDRIERGDTAQVCADLERSMPAVGPVLTRLLQPRAKDRFRNGQDLLVDLRRQLYRDRGSYLQEFCEFFFGSIFDLGEPPTLETAAPQAGAGRSSKRMSIEERLRQSMAREKRAQVTAGRAPAPRDKSTAPASRSAPRGPARPSAPRAPTPAPPTGGAGSRARPFSVPPPAPPRQAPRPVGQRSAEETGMLQMVPLTDDVDESDAAADPSATAFFAIPAPRAERGAPSPPPPPAVGGAPVAPAMPRPAVGQPAPPPMPGVAAPPPPPQPMVKGPVASYGGSGAGGTPFQVQGPPTSAPPADSGARVQSNRIYAILLGVFLLVCVSVLVAVWLRPTSDDEVPAVAQVTRPVVDNKVQRKARDTGIEEAAPAPKPTRKPHHTSSTHTSTTKTTPAPAAGPGTLTVKLSDLHAATAIEVVCPGGFRKRASVSGGTGTVRDVPQESCTLWFKGGAPAKFAPVHGSMSLRCDIIGTTASCK